MSDLVSTERIFANEAVDVMDGSVQVNWIKLVWVAGHGLGALAAVVIYPSFAAFVTFLLLTSVTICAGHSVGMHRLLIHRSFNTPKWVEYVLVWLGTLVGMAGPFGMIRAHDMRDWFQRQTICPDHPAHRAQAVKDAFWQICCDYKMRHPPQFQIEHTVAHDPVYHWIERTWMAQQLILVLPLYAVGGIGLVLWGVCLRVFVSLVGHWAIGHYAHRSGHQGWQIDGLPVQGYNLPRWAWISFGESWHSNHHAFPHSARLGVEAGQVDPGYWFVLALARLGLARNIQSPTSQPPRKGLVSAGGILKE